MPELERFIDAQKNTYSDALSEIKNGKKKSHWMWFVFPQVQGLGNSEFARKYAIRDLEEATEYLNHPELRARLVEISTAMLQSGHNNATAILGKPDDMKLHSSMTLFSLVEGADPVFKQVLNKFFGGKKDEKTLRILGRF
jgi:uncharacterized protein (DUF1810 family)